MTAALSLRDAPVAADSTTDRLVAALQVALVAREVAFRRYVETVHREGESAAGPLMAARVDAVVVALRCMRALEGYLLAKGRVS